jgi:hypothetical protein
MIRRSPIVPALVLIAIALGIAAVAAAAWRSQPQAGSPSLSLSSKQLQLAQTAANQALIKMFNARPGQVARGTTLVTTTGATATLQVRASNVRDIPGPNGGKLVANRRLWIDIRCVATPCPHDPVAYKGPLALMGTRSLGIWRPGTHRTYAVRVWLLRGGMPSTTSTGDNLYQHSTAKFGIVWTATGS